MKSLRFIGAGLILAAIFVSSALATTVMVMSLAPGRADLVINGATVRTLRDGQTSPEGVVLVSATREVAVIEVDGKRHTLTLGQGTASVHMLRADGRGHFVTTVYINGVPVTAMVDTGASVVALNRAEAVRLGVDLQQATRSIARTANGTIPVWNVTLASVQLGDILIRNVEAQVSEGGAEQSPIVLLGNSFLRHVDLIRSGNVLVVGKRW